MGWSAAAWYTPESPQAERADPGETARPRTPNLGARASGGGARAPRLRAGWGGWAWDDRSRLGFAAQGHGPTSGAGCLVSTTFDGGDGCDGAGGRERGAWGRWWAVGARRWGGVIVCATARRPSGERGEGRGFSGAKRSLAVAAGEPGSGRGSAAPEPSFDKWLWL